MNKPLGAKKTSAGEPSGDAQWSCDEIDRLYRQALDAFEAAASNLSSATQSLTAEQPADADAQANTDADTGAPATSESAARSAAADGEASLAVDDEHRVSGAQVIEALLFVGGQPLSTRTICGVLRGEFDADFVEQAVEALNRRYTAQNRPYEIRPGEGGYRIVLRGEFEPLRNRVYGFGPKHVRLSQETLEVLSLVAYRQPISRPAIEEIAKFSAGSHLRQLLQRELLVLEREAGDNPSEAVYRTSPRFLQLFGLGRLEELPQIEDLEFK